MYKLSNTGKMPGKSFSTPATTCKVGSCLAKLKGSVCNSCYARKGTYRYPVVQKVRQDNYDRYNEMPESFVAELTILIQAEYLKTGVPYFRWFDSGDIISIEMLRSILEIARLLPHIVFWLPTKEYTVIETITVELQEGGLKLPTNLTIRLSAYMIDGDYFKLPKHMSEIIQTRVINKDTPPLKTEMVCYGNCVLCNYACWDNTKNVAYIKH